MKAKELPQQTAFGGRASPGNVPETPGVEQETQSVGSRPAPRLSSGQTRVPPPPRPLVAQRWPTPPTFHPGPQSSGFHAWSPPHSPAGQELGSQISTPAPDGSLAPRGISTSAASHKDPPWHQRPRSSHCPPHLSPVRAWLAPSTQHGPSPPPAALQPSRGGPALPAHSHIPPAGPPVGSARGPRTALRCSGRIRSSGLHADPGPGTRQLPRLIKP